MINSIWNSNWSLRVSVAVVAIAGALVAPVSRLAINPGDATVTRDGVVLARTFPGDAMRLPRPRLSYYEVIRPLTIGHNGGHPCDQRGGPFLYSNANPVGTWALDWASACTDDPAGFEWSASWTWHLGALRMPAVHARTTVLTAY